MAESKAWRHLHDSQNQAPATVREPVLTCLAMQPLPEIRRPQPLHLIAYPHVLLT